MKCEGACEEHIGEVVLVTVIGWGDYHYCEAAIVEDKSRGLTLEIAQTQSLNATANVSATATEGSKG